MNRPKPVTDVTLSNTRPVTNMNSTEWNYLLEERSGIMEDSGIHPVVARARAIRDTTQNHGPRPEGTR